MKNSKKAFTLIELLVVVLIIGILAAVAVPQYQLAVEKTRAQEAVLNLRALEQAQRIYELETGNKTSVFENLTTKINGKIDKNQITTPNFSYHISNGKEIIATRNNNGNNLQDYIIYINRSGTWACRANTEQAKNICEHITGDSSADAHHNAYYYVFSNRF